MTSTNNAEGSTDKEVVRLARIKSPQILSENYLSGKAED